MRFPESGVSLNKKKKTGYNTFYVKVFQHRLNIFIFYKKLHMQYFFMYLCNLKKLG